MSIATPHRIRAGAVNEMSCIFWFHMRVMSAILCAMSMLPSVSVPLAFAMLGNTLCLAERIWDIQLRTLMYWHPFCQCVFLFSRLLLVTLTVIFIGVSIRICWGEGALISLCTYCFGRCGWIAGCRAPLPPSAPSGPAGA